MWACGEHTKFMKTKKKTCRSNAFTLVELLVAVTVIAVLAAALFSGLGRVRQAADKSRCMGNLRQLLAATVSCAMESGGKFPDMEGKKGPWMQDVLWPYLFGGGKTEAIAIKSTCFCCPAAQKNSTQAWMKNGVQYRYNSFTAPNKMPRGSYSEAVVLFDKQWGDWAPENWSHQPGPGAVVNIGYADGHIVAMPYAEYHEICGWGGSVESFCPIYQKGWKE